MKKLLLAAALLGASPANARNFDVTVRGPAAIGSGQIKSGDYKLELKGDRVLLKDGKMVDEFPVEVRNDTRKFDTTSIVYVSDGDKMRIQEIQLGGTTLRLVFNN